MSAWGAGCARWFWSRPGSRRRVRRCSTSSPGRTWDARRGRLPRSCGVLERGADLVLAEHFTRVGPLTAVTLETVSFDRPSRIGFRLVRGPVPHVTEEFALEELDEATATRLVYRGELGTDFWSAGALWGGVVARRWKQVVRASLESIRMESERRGGGSLNPPPRSPVRRVSRCWVPRRSWRAVGGAPVSTRYLNAASACRPSRRDWKETRGSRSRAGRPPLSMTSALVVSSVCRPAAVIDHSLRA